MSMKLMAKAMEIKVGNPLRKLVEPPRVSWRVFYL